MNKNELISEENINRFNIDTSQIDDIANMINITEIISYIKDNECEYSNWLTQKK